MLGKLENGSSITLIGETNGWYQINYKGHVGYISGEFVVLSSRWKIIVNVNSEDDKNSITSYLKSKGYNPVIEKLGD